MADVRHLQKPLNRYISATAQQIAMKLAIVTHFKPLKPTQDQKLLYLSNGLIDFDKYLHGDHTLTL